MRLRLKGREKTYLFTCTDIYIGVFIRKGGGVPKEDELRCLPLFYD